MNSMFKKVTLSLNIQRFNEGEGSGGAGQQQQQQQQQQSQQSNSQQQQQQQSQGVVFSEDYVKSLRGEAANHRTEKQKYQAHLRSLMGLAPDAELNETMITNFQKEQAQAQKKVLETANARLLTAEIKSLEGYNAKLVEKLLDKSKITIGEDGAITGLTEAVAELEKEFPEIKTTGGTGTGGANPAGGNGTHLTELQQLEEDYKNAKDNATRVMIKNQIYALQNKK